MRALCGAIITAGALIGLGLASIGYGLRYQNYNFNPKDGSTIINPHTDHMYGATALMVIQVALLLALAVGLAVAFLGLMYHHYRRMQELERLHGGATGMAPSGIMPAMGMPAPPRPTA